MSPDWSLGANWVGGMVPGPTGSVRIDTDAQNPAVASGISFTSNQSIRVGDALNSIGVLSLTGGSAFSVAGLTIGNHGTGTLTVFDSTLSSTGFTWLGDSSTGNGTLNVQGPSARFNALTSFIDVGNRGMGTLNITNGGQVRTRTGYVGDNPGSQGFVTVSGAGSLWEISNFLGAGGDGDATIRIENGGAMTVGVEAGLSYTETSNSLMTVTGAGSSFTAAEFAVGVFGAAELWLDDGGLVVTPDFYLGYGPDAAGTLVLGSGGTLRVGQIIKGAGTADVQLDSGTIRASEDQADWMTNFVAGDIQILAGGVTLDSNGFDLRVAAPLAGTGMLVKAGSGTLTLSGANSYTGGTDVAAGTLAGSLASIRGAIRNAGIVRLDQAVDGTVAGDVTGLNGVFGQMVKTGAGTVTLAGSNALDWTVNGGGLVGQVDRFSGNVALASGTSLGLTGPVNGTYAGVLSGTGAVLLDGAGAARLTGNSAGFAGMTTVTAPVLRLDGSLGGTLAIGPGSRLDGIGTGGNLVLGAGTVISPGPGIGVLSFTGDVTFDPSTSFAVELAGSGAADRLAVGGRASVAGTVSVTGVDGQASYQDGVVYRILDASVVDGAFIDAVSQSSFLQFEIQQSTDAVDLVVAVADLPPDPDPGPGPDPDPGPGPGPDPTPDPDPGPTPDPDPIPGVEPEPEGEAPVVFRRAARTFNQMDAAEALDGFEQSGDALLVYNSFLMLSAAEAQEGFGQISGEVHASAQWLEAESFALFADHLLDHSGASWAPRLSEEGTLLGYAALPEASNPGLMAIGEAEVGLPGAYWSVWLTPMLARGTVASTGNAGAMDWSSAGLAGGVETQTEVFGGTARVGLGQGYQRSLAEIDTRLSSVTSDAGSIGLYGNWSDGVVRLSGALGASLAHKSTTRRIMVGGLDRTATADYWSQNLGAALEASYAFELGEGFTLAPVATLAAGWSGHGGATESGAGALNATLAPASLFKVDLGIGLAAEYAFTLASGQDLTLSGRVIYEHGLGEDSPDQELWLAGSGTEIGVDGVASMGGRWRVGAGLSYQVSDDLSLSLQYDGVLSDQEQSHAGKVGLQLKF